MVEKECANCKTLFEPKNKKASFCSGKCRVAYFRKQRQSQKPKKETTIPCNDSKITTALAICNDSTERNDSKPQTAIVTCNDLKAKSPIIDCNDSALDDTSKSNNLEPSQTPESTLTITLSDEFFIRLLKPVFEFFDL